jgi:multidrug efflux system membrane fusion protein
MPPTPVSVAQAAREVVPVEVRAVGTVEPYSTVQIRSQVPGELLRVRFAEGSQINQGDLLLEIDPRPYREALRQAEATVVRDQAQVRQAQATLGRDRAQALATEADRKRYEELVKEGIAARAQYDQVRASADALQAIRARSAGSMLPVEALPGDAPGKTARGYLAVIDNSVDSTTGTIRLKAAFDNRERRLWPGQFVNVVLRLETGAATVVPSEAVQAGQQGQFVYVVKPDQTVEFRPVAAGITVDGKTVIEKGVAPGETVVTDGQLRLFPGARIQAVPASRIDSQQL